MKKQDIRVQRSKEWLYQALVSLAQEIPFKDITISRLSAKAGVARQTFYRNYHSIEDILLERHRSLLEQFSQRAAPLPDFEHLISDVVDKWFAHKDLFLTFSKAGLSEIFMDNVKEHAEQMCQRAMPWLDDPKDIRLVSSFLSGGLLMVQKEWLKDPSAYTREELVEKLQVFIKSANSYKKP